MKGDFAEARSKFDISWQKESKKQDGSTTSKTMDILSTYRVQRTISELNSLFDPLEKMMFLSSLSMALNT